MERYAYWTPGGKGGEVSAESTFNAAKKILGTENVYYCGGIAAGLNHAIYCGNNGDTSTHKECKIWTEQH